MPSVELSAFDGSLTMIIKQGLSVGFFAGIATRLSGSLKTLRSYCAPRLSTLSAQTLNSLTPSRRKTFAQIVPFIVFIHGIDMIYAPAAWITAGVLVFAALELR